MSGPTGGVIRVGIKLRASRIYERGEGVGVGKSAQARIHPAAPPAAVLGAYLPGGGRAKNCPDLCEVVDGLAPGYHTPGINR